jgi:hypothetical protein
MKDFFIGIFKIGMLNYVQKYFKKIYILGLWLYVLLCIYSGGKFGYSIGYHIDEEEWQGVLGVFIGIPVGYLFGLISAVIIGGMIATFLKINDNLQIIVDKSEQK